MKTYLFVCWQNYVRSVIAAGFFHDLLKAKGIEARVLDAGLSRRADNPLTGQLCSQADIIFVMKKYMIEEVLKREPISKSKIINLDILDIYSYGGSYSEEMFAAYFNLATTAARQHKLNSRIEVKEKLSLEEVLKLRDLWQYIIKE